MIEKDVLVDLLNQRLSTKKIAMRLGLSVKTVSYWERVYDLPPAFPQHRASDRRLSPEEIANAPIIHRRRIKARAIEYKGGKCVLCGYDRCNAALEFHHLDKTKKGFGLSRGGRIRSWESIKAELEKCVLVCANCHREVEAGVRELPAV